MTIQSWMIWDIFTGVAAKEPEAFTADSVKRALSRFRLAAEEVDSIVRTVHNEDELKVILRELEARKTKELTCKILNLAFPYVGGNERHAGQAALVCEANRAALDGTLHVAFASLREELTLFSDLRRQAFADAAAMALPEPLISGYLQFRASKEGAVSLWVMKRENQAWIAKAIIELEDRTVNQDRNFWTSVSQTQTKWGLEEHDGEKVLNWLAAERCIANVKVG